MTTSTRVLRGTFMLSSAASALLLGLMAAPVSAQTAEEAPQDVTGDDIVVTGFRASVQNSIDAKRESPIIVDVISSDDIAGLPDVSIAEAIARLPGVTSQRTGGQASAINIRGLSQDLVSATLNGREQVSTSGLRTIEFDQYPSELLNQAAVYKSPMASLIEGGVAGKVELKTVRPLDSKERFSATVNVRGSYNDRASDSPDADEYGYRVSAAVQGKLLDNRLGFAIGYARLVQPNVATRFVGFDYTGTGTNGGGNALDLNGDGVRDGISYGFEAIQFGGTETRDGVLGVIQFEPTSSTRLLIDGYYSRFESDVRRRGIRVLGTQNGNTTTGTLTDPIVGDTAIIGGRFTSGNGLDVESVNQDESDRDRLYTVGANLQQDIGDRLTVSLDASYSTANSRFVNTGVNVNAYAATGGGFTRLSSIPGALVVDYRLNGLEMPNVSINHDFTNPTLNRFQGFFIVPQEDNDELTAFAGDVDYRIDGSFLKSIQLGARYSTRTARRTVTTFNSFGIAAPVALPDGTYEQGSFSGDMGANGFPDFLAVDIYKLLDQFVGPDREPRQDYPFLGFTYDQSFRIDEKVWAGYGQINFDTLAGGLNFKGNIGLRVVRTEQSSTSSLADPRPQPGPGDPPLDPPYPEGGRYISTVGDTYTEFLPSANFILELSDQDRLRLSFSRQMSRARFFELRNAITFGLNNIGGGVYQPNGSGGNPRLRPYLAKQFDFGYEHYFGSSGIFAVNVFYKDLESFITTGTIDDFNFREAGLTYPPLPGGASPGSTTLDSGPLRAPINGDGGYLYGLEAQFSKTFVELPAPFDGLGMIINYAYTESDLDVQSSLSGRTVTIPLPGLSKHVINPTLFYEKSGFSTRVGVRYRSGFVAPQFGLNEQITGNASETVVDAQVSYAFQPDSALNGLTLYLQGNNLTDAPTRSFFGLEEQTGTIQQFGRVFYAGATFKF